MATSWVAELDKKEHKNWVMVGCALNIAKNGISQLIQRKMEAWYQSLISSPSLQSLAPCTCVPGSPKWCGTCIMWKTELKRHDKFKQPKIPNSDRTQWGSVTGAWEIAKVFMSTLGSRKTLVVDAETTDVGGLLNLLEQCPFFQPPVNPIVLSLARDKCRNHWAHAPKQELQDADVNSIFGHLNNLLNEPVFLADSAAQQSSKDLQDLRNNGVVNIRDSEVDVLHLLRQSLLADLVKCRNDLADVQDKVVQMDTERTKVHEAVQKEISELGEQGDLNREKIVKLKQQLNIEVKQIKTDLKDNVSKVLNAVEDFNRQLNERDDFMEAFKLIREDVENIAMELTTTKSQVDKLEIKLESFQHEVEIKFASMECKVKGLANNVTTNINTISGLQKDFTEVKEEVETLKTKPLEGQLQDSDDSDALCTAPSRLTTFTGRDAALAWLEQNLAPDQISDCPGISCRTKAICGLGGCGKTSLAVEFSWRCKNRFPGGVFWINGESDENITQSVVENLALLNISASTSEKLDDMINRFLAKLCREKRSWLLVVDNADELQDPTCPAGMKKICKGPWQRNGSASKHGNILFTTRRSAKDTEMFLKLPSENCFQLQSFNEEEGALFLMQRTGFKEASLDPDAILLAKELGSLPLALEQAAAYLSSLPIPCSFKAYLEKYRAVKLRLLEKQPATALSMEAQHRLSVHTTWEMNFEFVKEKSPAAATMMRIAAFLESDNVPIDVINPGFPEIVQEDLRESARSEIDVDAILKVLSSYSLLSVDQKRRGFAIHKLVQEVVRESLTSAGRVEILVAASRVLHFAFKANNAEEEIILALQLNFRKLKNNMEKESKLLKEDSLQALYNTEILELCTTACKFHDNIFLWGFYAELLEFKLRVLRLVHSDDVLPDLVLSLMVQTGQCKQWLSVPEIDKEAKKLSDNAMKKLIELQQSGVEVNVDIIVDVLCQNASFYALENQWEENYIALLQLEELPVSMKKFVDLQQNIARAETFLSLPQSALRRFQNTLRIARKIHPSNSFVFSTLLEEISRLLYDTGKTQEAKPYAQELWEICKNQSPSSPGYIPWITTVMRVKCDLEPHAWKDWEDTMVDILKGNWPRVYGMATSLGQRQVNVEELIVGDGTEKDLVLALRSLLKCLFAVKTGKAVNRNFSISDLNFYRTIAEIHLCILKSLFGEIHSNMEEAYEWLKRVHEILGNEKEVLRLQELVDKCQQLVPGRKKSVFLTVPLIDNLIHSRMCKNSGNIFFRAGNYSDALELYNQALGLSPNAAELLCNKAATCVKLSERSTVVLDKQKFLEQALQASQHALTADPSWVGGYYWKAVSLAHLGKRGPSLSAAAVAKHLCPSQCAKIPAVVDHFGSYDVQVVTTNLDLLYATERRNSRNAVIVVKEGKYELMSPLKIPENAVIVGLGDVQIYCSKGVPLRLNKTVYMENISLSPRLEILKERAKRYLTDGEVDEALSLYNQALISCPNNPQILTSRAMTYLKSAEQKKDSSFGRKTVLELGLKDAEAAIKADPTWLLGYYTKAAVLAELDRKQQALAAAAVFKQLSLGRDVPGVTQRYSNLQVLVVQSSDELCSVADRIKKLEGVNQVVLIKEGEYQCERSVKIPQKIVVVGQGKVTVSCKNGATCRFTEICYVENVEIIANCDSEDEQL